MEESPSRTTSNKGRATVKRLKPRKETLRDLDGKRGAAKVRGGGVKPSTLVLTCVCPAGPLPIPYP